MNLKTYLLCLVLAGTGLSLQAMLNNVQNQFKIGRLKDAINKSQGSSVKSLLAEIAGPLPDTILFSLNGDTDRDIAIFDTLILNLKSDSIDLARVINVRNLNIQNKTMVHVAIEKGWVNILTKLIELGASLTAVSDSGKTSLAMAVERYCLLYGSGKEPTAKQVIELVKRHVTLSIADYKRDVQVAVSRKFNFEESSSVAHKLPLPEFLKMETFKLAKRDLLGQSVTVATAPVVAQPQPMDYSAALANGTQPEITSFAQPQHGSELAVSMPVQTVPPVSANTDDGGWTVDQEKMKRQRQKLQDAQTIQGLRGAIRDFDIHLVNLTLNKNPELVLPEDIFIDLYDKDDGSIVLIINAISQHIKKKNQQSLGLYLKHAVAHRGTYVLNLLLAAGATIDSEILQCAAQSLVNNAQSNQSPNVALQILQELEKDVTLSMPDKQTMQNILATQFYWGVGVGQPDKHPLPDVCKAMVASAQCNIILPETTANAVNPSVPTILTDDISTIDNNPVPLALTSNSRIILGFSACALICIAAYKYLYAQDSGDEDSQEDDEQSGHDLIESVVDVQNPAL